MRYVGRHRAARPLVLRRPAVGGTAAAVVLAVPVLYLTGNLGTGDGTKPTASIAEGAPTLTPNTSATDDPLVPDLSAESPIPTTGPASPASTPVAKAGTAPTNLYVPRVSNGGSGDGSGARSGGGSGNGSGGGSGSTPKQTTKHTPKKPPKRPATPPPPPASTKTPTPTPTPSPPASTPPPATSGPGQIGQASSVTSTATTTPRISGSSV